MKTLKECEQEFSDAKRAFLLEVALSLKIYEFFDWLTYKLKKITKGRF